MSVFTETFPWKLQGGFLEGWGRKWVSPGRMDAPAGVLEEQLSCPALSSVGATSQVLPGCALTLFPVTGSAPRSVPPSGQRLCGPFTFPMMRSDCHSWGARAGGRRGQGPPKPRPRGSCPPLTPTPGQAHTDHHARGSERTRHPPAPAGLRSQPWLRRQSLFTGVCQAVNTP